MTGPEVTSVLGADVRWQSVPDDLPNAERLPTAEGTRLLVRPGEVLYENNFVRLLVRETDEVLIEPVGAVLPEVVAHHAYGIGARILLLHAGVFSLHASVVESPTGVLAIGGESGAGKSTTSVAIGQRTGCRLLVDDTAPIRVEDGRPVVVPFDRPAHLHPQTARHLGVGGSPADDPHAPEWPVPGETKVAVRLAEPRERPLDRLAVLVAAAAADTAGPVAVCPIRGADRLRAVIRLSNTTGLATAAGRRDAYLAWAVHVADTVPMIEVRRRAETDTLAAVIATLLDPDSW